MKIKSKFLKDNLVLFIGLFTNAAFSYLFHFIMGRSLGPSGYGDLNVIIAINYIILVFFNTIQTSITRFTAKYKTKNEFGKVNSLIRSASKSLLKKSLIISFIFSLTIPLLGKFLKLSNPWILIWLIPIIIISLIYPITRGALQGLQKFKSLSISYIGEGSIKVISGIILIALGLKTHGAVIAIGIGLILSYLLTLKPLKTILKTAKESINKKEIYSYSFPALITIFFLTLMFSLDILLVKHFLPEKQAGFYAALAIFGKVILFSIIPITQVMFPKITEAKELNKNYKKILYKSLILSSLISIIILAIFFFLPKLMVTTLFGNEYSSIIPLLGLMGLMMVFFSISYLLCFYNLSLNRKNFNWIILVFLIAEITAIITSHTTLFEIIRNLTIIMFFFLISMLIYTFIRKPSLTS